MVLEGGVLAQLAHAGDGGLHRGRAHVGERAGEQLDDVLVHEGGVVGVGRRALGLFLFFLLLLVVGESERECCRRRRSATTHKTTRAKNNK